jgi:predicted RNase H-like nuclease (RuvC/YqgF family)
MKLYEVIKLETNLKRKLNDLYQRFQENNSVLLDVERDYDPKNILDEINKKQREIINLRFKIERCNLDIAELKAKNEIFNQAIEVLKNIRCNIKNEYNSTYGRVDIDNMIEEYQNKIDKNIATIDYFYFTTDIEI